MTEGQNNKKRERGKDIKNEKIEKQKDRRRVRQKDINAE